MNSTTTTTKARTTTTIPIPIPMPPRLPVLGHLPWLLRPAGPMAWFAVLAKRYREAGIFQITTPSKLDPIFVVNVDVAAELFDEKRFEKVIDGPLLRIKRFAGDGLFTAGNDDDNWHTAHRLLTPGFARGAMDRYFPMMRSTLQELVESWGRADDDDRAVDVTADMTRLTLETISRCGFDHDFGSFDRSRDDGELDPFLQALARCMSEAVTGVHRPARLAPLFKKKEAQFTADIEEMFVLVDDVIAKRKTLPRDQWPQDFLSLMLEPDSSSNTWRADTSLNSGARLDAENVRFQILTFLIAGHETTSGLLAFALHRIASDKALLKALRAEIDAAFGDREPTRDDVWGLQLLMRVINEAMRLWPTVPVFGVTPKQDEVIAGRFAIRAGTPLKVLVVGLHTDPAVWPDPLRAEIDRFLPDEVAKRPAAAFKPFGNGKRACIGRQFALLETALALAILVRDFDFDTPAPLNVAATTSPKPKDFTVRVRTRVTSSATAKALDTTTMKTAARGGCPFQHAQAT